MANSGDRAVDSSTGSPVAPILRGAWLLLGTGGVAMLIARCRRLLGA